MSFAAYSQNPVIDGCWWGSLDLGGQKLNIGFKIVIQDDGRTVGFMDVPQQGAKEIPAARYTGVRVSADRIEGTFLQNGMSLGLSLQPGEVPVNRPQTPQPPYPYLTEEVTFENAGEGAILSGTLTYPVMHFIYPPGTIPVVLMVTGSGQQNRDEELASLQALWKESRPGITRLMPRGISYDSLNHLFQHCTVQNSLNYAAIEETISAEVLNDISHWINSVK